MTEIEYKFDLSCEALETGQKEQAYRLLYEGYLAYCNNPFILNEVKHYALVGNCLYGFYFTPTIQNSNDTIKEQVSSIAILFLSKAINSDPKNLQLRISRIHMLDEAKEYIKHIFVESEIDIPSYSVYFVSESPTHRALVDIDKMIYSELVNFPQIVSKLYFSTLKEELENDRLVPNRFVMSTIDSEMKIKFTKEGERFLNDFILFLNHKVCENGDIDFDTEYD